VTWGDRKRRAQISEKGFPYWSRALEEFGGVRPECENIKTYEEGFQSPLSAKSLRSHAPVEPLESLEKKSDYKGLPSRVIQGAVRTGGI